MAGKKIEPRDLILFSVFGLFAFTFFWGAWNGLKPFVDLWADGTVVAGYTAALDHPAAFRGDALLGEPQSLNYYMAAHIPLIRLLNTATHDYGTAYILLLGPTIFIQLLGFYLLGRQLYGNRFWAAVLAGASLVTIFYGAGDYWGLFPDPQPRFLFQAFFPFLLLLSLRWRSRLDRWPILMALAGVLLYLHPVSGPTAGFMIWAGLLTCKPPEWQWRKYLPYLFALGCVFLLVTAPFWLTYFGVAHPGFAVDYQKAYAFFHTGLRPLMDVPALLGEYAGSLWQYGLLIPAVLGAVIGLRFSNTDGGSTRLILVWLAGCYFIALAVPWAEHAAEAALQKLPLEVDLVRGLRYTFPLLLMLGLIPLVRLAELPALRSFRAGPLIAPGLAIVLTAFFVSNAVRLLPERGYAFPFYPQLAIDCWLSRHLICPRPYEQNAIAMLQFVKERTPEDSGFIAIPTGRMQNELRYAALRPIRLGLGDSARLFYTDINLAIQNADAERRWAGINSLPSRKDRIDAFVALACDVHADYILADRDLPAQAFAGRDNLEIDYQNHSFTVLKILSCTP